MAEGCKRKGMHKSMLCQLLNRNFFYVISVYFLIDVKQIIYLSNLFNDLIDHFGPECEPLELNRKPISCLLYADDIVLLSESAKGLQKSINPEVNQ
jgi:hypothetical protein